MNKKQIAFLKKLNGKQLFKLREKVGIKKFGEICQLWLEIRENEIGKIINEL